MALLHAQGVTGEDGLFVQKQVAERFRDWQAGHFLQPEVLTARVDLQEDVATVGREDQVNGSVQQSELADQEHAVPLDVRRKLVWRMRRVVQVIAAPVVARMV